MRCAGWGCGCVFLLPALFLIPASTAGAVQIRIGSATGVVGETVDIPVTIRTQGAQVAGAQLDIRTDLNLRIPRSGDHPGLHRQSRDGSADSTFADLPDGCDPNSNCNGVRPPSGRSRTQPRSRTQRNFSVAA